MGTKRPFDEDLQEFIKHPKHLEYGHKLDLFREDKIPLEMSENDGIAGEGGAKFFHTGDNLQSENVFTVPDTVDKESEMNAPSPLATGVSGDQENAGPGPGFCSNLFPELFEFNMPRRLIVHYDDTYSSLLNGPPRKEVPLGPEHQADVPEFDSDIARNYCNSIGIHIIPISNPDFSNKEGEIENAEIDCECLDGGSIRCVQEHVNEARLKLKQSLGIKKFVDLGFDEMGEEVSRNWSEEDEQLFHDVVYSNPVSHSKRFWEQLAIVFPSRTKKDLVSYYFNVFMLRRRAVQNRSKLLEIDSDDDEWWGTKRGSFGGVKVEDEDFIVVGSCGGDGDHESASSEDGSSNGGGEGDSVVHEGASENEQEKLSNGGLRSESYLHWDPPYSTMGSTKGVDLLPTCSMIEEIFGSSKTGEST